MATHFLGPVLNRDIIDHQRGWFSNLPVGNSPDYVKYFNDFVNTADYAATDWTITTTEAGAGDATEAIGANTLNGTLVITNDAASADLDSLQLNEETFAFTAGKRLWYECKFKVSDVALCTAYVGLGVTDTTPLTTSDRIGFQITSGAATILFKNCGSSVTETSTSTGVAAVADTYVTVGFYYDGGTKVNYYVNRAYKGTIGSNLPAVNICPTLYVKNGEAVAKVLTVDYIYVMGER